MHLVDACMNTFASRPDGQTACRLTTVALQAKSPKRADAAIPQIHPPLSDVPNNLLYSPADTRRTGNKLHGHCIGPAQRVSEAYFWAETRSDLFAKHKHHTYCPATRCCVLTFGCVMIRAVWRPFVGDCTDGAHTRISCCHG